MAETKFNPGKRIWVVCIVGLGLFIGLGTRLGYLQIVRGQYFEALAENQRKRTGDLLPHRGTIYVSEGRNEATKETFPIATNKQSWKVYAVPKDMKDPDKIAEELAPALLAFQDRQRDHVRQILESTGQGNPETDPTPEGSEDDRVAVLRQELQTKFDQRTDPYEPILKPYETLDDDFKQFLDTHTMPGLVMQEEEVRVYPEKTLAAQVLGYVGYQDDKRVGKYGIEGFFNNKLEGTQGFLSGERDAKGQLIGVGGHEFQAAQDGMDIELTIDRVVQSIIEDELRNGVEKYQAERGSVLVMNPKTGAILGMATYPTFDPNYYYAIKDPRVQSNPIVSDIFEPGSILKPVVMAAAIEEGKVTPDTTFVDSGPVKVAEYTIDTFDGKHHGVQTMTQILEQSNNVGMVWVGQQLGAETMYDYFRRFGLGEKTGIELEGETQNQLPVPSKWNVTTVATTSFGQGIALTPLQALNAINVLANGGQLMQPQIVAKTTTADGQVTKSVPTPVQQVVSQATAQKLSSMMVSVIENGVAGLARVPGYYLAGKTGTAQVPDEHGQYSKDRKIISFVGFGPVQDPQFSILIKLDNPAGLSFASGTAAPMFHNIAEKLLQYYQIPPNYDPHTKPHFQVSTGLNLPSSTPTP